MEDRLKALEMANVSLKNYIDYHQVVHKIDHMSALHVDSSFYKQSMKTDNHHKIAEWIDSLIGHQQQFKNLIKKAYIIQPKSNTKQEEVR